ncbi:MAG: hypothetical protein HY535_07195 [Chloroflexi bacterium]|nr:hypothetical protein [Chloroflexota bacterium]
MTDVLVVYEHALAGRSLAMWLGQEVPGIHVECMPLHDAGSFLAERSFRPRIVFLEANDAANTSKRFVPGPWEALLRTSWATGETAVKGPEGWIPVSAGEVRELAHEICRRARAD